MLFAIIETGGKQYLVSPKEKLKIEKLPAEKSQEVVFDKVLLISDDKDLRLGHPFINGAKVTAKVLKSGRERKIKIFKYRAKVRYRRHLGHRQRFTEIEIKSMS